MKKCIYFLLLTSELALLAACKKDNGHNEGIASLNVINAISDQPSLYVYFTLSDSNFYLQQRSVDYGTRTIYATASGKNDLSIISMSDTTRPLLQTSHFLDPGGIYSLFLSGLSDHPDTVFVRDTLPAHTDSSAGCRFINLATGSLSVTINLAGNTSEQTEFPVLGYRQVTSFKSYAVTNRTKSYNFEIHDQATGDLLTTFTWSIALFKNHTLVITNSGDLSAGGSFTVFQVKNF